MIEKAVWLLSREFSSSPGQAGAHSVSSSFTGRSSSRSNSGEFGARVGVDLAAFTPIAAVPVREGSQDGTSWDAQQNVSGTGTSRGPALTAI